MKIILTESQISQLKIDLLEGKLGTTEMFIEKSRKVHGDKYDYSKSEYKGKRSRLTVTCPKHGDFEILPDRHYSGDGCPKCSKEKNAQNQFNRRFTNDIFIEKARKVHGDKYDYSQVNYETARIPITVICPKHGPFEITPNKHLLGGGCKECHFDKKRHSKNDFIEKAKLVHGDKYNYSKVKYVNDMTPVEIICPKHGSFYATPNNHVSKSSGCASCKESNGEKTLRSILKDKGLKFIPQATFTECLNYTDENTCVRSTKLKFDFYLPDLNTLVEYDGGFHFIQMPIVKDEQFIRNILNDKQKNNFAKRKGIKLIRIAYTDLKNLLEELEKGLESDKQMYLSTKYPTDKGWLSYL